MPWGPAEGAEGTGRGLRRSSSFLCPPSQLNLSRPIEEQGPLDVIIHKLTDVIIEADQNDSQSLELVHRFQVRGWCGGEGRALGELPQLSGCGPPEVARLPSGLGLVVRHLPARASVWLGVRWD